MWFIQHNTFLFCSSDDLVILSDRPLCFGKILMELDTESSLKLWDVWQFYVYILYILICHLSLLFSAHPNLQEHVHIFNYWTSISLLIWIFVTVIVRSSQSPGFHLALRLVRCQQNCQVPCHQRCWTQFRWSLAGMMGWSLFVLFISWMKYLTD